MTSQKSFEIILLLYIETKCEEIVILMIIQVGVTIITIMLFIDLFIKRQQVSMH
jgi:hypothetical protein